MADAIVSDPSLVKGMDNETEILHAAQDLITKKNKEAFKRYSALAGEIEARDTTERLSLTPSGTRPELAGRGKTGGRIFNGWPKATSSRRN